jgi:Predicted membrane protein
MGGNNMAKVNRSSPKKVFMKKDIKNKESQGIFIFIGIAIVVLALGYSFWGKLDGRSKNSNNNPTLVSSEGGIKINKQDITSTAKFYPYESDGIKMEVLAVKANDGTIRTAFNTCQVCFSSGRGYYKQEGDELVCQNCGNRFKIDMIGSAKNGCNPVPILNSNKTEDKTNIVISKDYLDNNKKFFANWKS